MYPQLVLRDNCGMANQNGGIDLHDGTDLSVVGKGIPGSGIEGVELYTLKGIMDPGFKRRFLLFVSSASPEELLPRR